jgi:hypothetical protein
MGPDPVLESVEDRTQVEVVDLEGAEVAFHLRQVLVGRSYGS